jgi:hypothetical protein
MNPQHESAAHAAAQLEGFIEGVWHPEDLARLEGTPWVIVSAMRSTHRRGALLALNVETPDRAFELEWLAQAEAGRQGPKEFSPHGIDARRIDANAFELLVVDHGAGEAIDRLRIEIRDGRPVLVAGVRIEQPIGTSGNAVAFLSDGGFVMTSMFDPRDTSFIRKFASAEKTGGVWRWSQTRGWTRVGPDLSGANGIAVAANDTQLFVSEWAARTVWRLSIDGEIEARVDIDFLPDNLRWADDGSLLLAGQLANPEALFGCEARGDCPLAYVAARLNPHTLRLTPILRVGHSEALAVGFGGATGALQIRDEIWVGTFTGERIARFRLTAV